ncbi:MAG: threonine aldolase family protein, partial [Planctomycetaceae bacterium]
CGAPAFFGRGLGLHAVAGADARLDPAAVAQALQTRGDVHAPLPRALSLTHATEWGTVYSVEHVRELGAVARRHQAVVHMDGARLANALAELGCSPAELTWRAGVDVLCLGGTKNGLAVGEAVLFFRADLAREFAWRCKQAGQLASKMRLLTAPWVGLLESGDWLANARQANAMAGLLDQRLRRIAGVRVLVPRQANSVFVQLPAQVSAGLREAGWRFYTFIGDDGVRLMCSWDTTPADIDALVADLERLLPDEGVTI